MSMLVVKATLAMMAALAIVTLSRRVRASRRHLVLASLFAFLLLLPVVQRLAPAVDVAVDAPALAPLAAPPRGMETARTTATPEQPATARAEESSVDVAGVAATVYGAGLTLLLGWLAAGLLRLYRLAATAEVWIEGTTRMNEIALSERIRRSALVITTPQVAAPLTFGFRRSTIVLPDEARRWDADELTRALRHELEHIRRDDWFLQLAARVAVTFLLDRGADVNLGVAGDGSPLIMAAREGKRDIVVLLLGRGADIDAIVPGDENPLIQASAAGREDVVRLLIERGADVNARAIEDDEVRTPLSMARRGGHTTIEQILLRAGARS